MDSCVKCEARVETPRDKWDEKEKENRHGFGNDEVTSDLGEWSDTVFAKGRVSRARLAEIR